MTNETDMSEIQSVYMAARDGEVTGIVDILLNLDRNSVVQDILNHHTEDDGQITTPLIIAARNGNEDVVHVLLNVFCVDSEQTGTVIFGEETVKEATALWCAAGIGHIGIVKLLVEYGANANHMTSENSTPLRSACFGGNLEIVKYLVEHKADVSAVTSYKNNCLSLACIKGHYSVAEYLIQKGENLDSKNIYGRTALHNCAETGQVKIIDMLLKYGANITTDEDNMTPLMIAALYGETEVVEYFISAVKCLRKDKIDAYELLGTTLGVTSKYDIDTAFHYLKKAIIERHKNKNDVIEKVLSSPIPAYDNWIECKTIRELEHIKTNDTALQMECLAIRERVLGPCHDDVTEALVYTGAQFADKQIYDKCINLWHHALELSHKTYFILGFPEIFVDMFEAEAGLGLKDVIETFERLTLELETIMMQMAKSKDTLQEKREDITTACVYLAGVMHTISKNADEIDRIHRTIYKFIRQNPRLQNGFTPLHICCSSAKYTSYVPLLNFVTFPNISLYKIFIACGASVNAVDNKNNTPLHTIAECANIIDDYDFLFEILVCLIEDGAHVDSCNSEGETAMNVATTDTVKSILMSHRKLSLKCQAARAIKRYKVQYKDIIPNDLQEYVELH